MHICFRNVTTMHWPSAFSILLRNFQLDQILQYRVQTFHYITADARPLFHIKHLSQLPNREYFPTADFLHKRVLHLFNALPALILRYVPGQCNLACIDLIKSNCQKILMENGQHCITMRVNPLRTEPTNV